MDAYQVYVLQNSEGRFYWLARLRGAEAEELCRCVGKKRKRDHLRQAGDRPEGEGVGPAKQVGALLEGVAVVPAEVLSQQCSGVGAEREPGQRGRRVGWGWGVDKDRGKRICGGFANGERSYVSWSNGEAVGAYFERDRATGWDGVIGVSKAGELAAVKRFSYPLEREVVRPNVKQPRIDPARKADCEQVVCGGGGTRVPNRVPEDTLWPWVVVVVFSKEVGECNFHGRPLLSQERRTCGVNGIQNQKARPVQIHRLERWQESFGKSR